MILKIRKRKKKPPSLMDAKMAMAEQIISTPSPSPNFQKWLDDKMTEKVKPNPATKHGEWCHKHADYDPEWKGHPILCQRGLTGIKYNALFRCNICGKEFIELQFNDLDERADGEYPWPNGPLVKTRPKEVGPGKIPPALALRIIKGE